MPEDNKAAPANAIPTAVAVMPRAARSSVALQAAHPSTPAIVTRELDAAVASFLPSTIAADCPADMREDCRQWLADTPPPTVQPRGGATGQQAGVDYGAPPVGLGGVECVLWHDLGRACARAVLWLGRYLKTHRYMVACRESGLESHEVAACKIASPTFAVLFEAVQAHVRGGTVAQTEDTLADLANGAIRKIKTERGADGEVIKEVDEGAVYDTKAAALLLPALDPNRYGAGKLGGGAAGVVINLSFSGVAWQPGAVEASVGPAAYDADEAGALTDTEEELA